MKKAMNRKGNNPMSLAIAYAIRKKNAMKKAKGGMIENEDFDPEHEDPTAIETQDLEGESDQDRPDIAFMSHGGMAKAIMKKKKMADGGSVDDVPEPNKKAASEFSKGASSSGYEGMDTYIKNAKEGIKSAMGYADGGEVHPDDDFLSDEEQTPYFHKSEDDLEPKAKRRNMISSIMSSLHSRHYGK